MKYLTKEWYHLSQRTGLHFGMKVNNGAAVYDEALYLRLYKRKEKDYIAMQQKFHDIDPRFMLEQDESTFVRLDKFAKGEEITEEDSIIYHMSPEEREAIQKLIEEYDARPPFDEEKSREEFRSLQEMIKKRVEEELLPPDHTLHIADMRVFSLGYCTKEVRKLLKKISKESEAIRDRVLSEYSKAQQAENIPQDIRESFGFHDCRVTEFTVGSNVVLRFDTRGEYADMNKLTFATAKIIKQEEHIVGSSWIYQELYRTEDGYEAHMLFDREGVLELTIRCKDIIIEQ